MILGVSDRVALHSTKTTTEDIGRENQKQSSLTVQATEEDSEDRCSNGGWLSSSLLVEGGGGVGEVGERPSLGSFQPEKGVSMCKCSLRLFSWPKNLTNETYMRLVCMGFLNCDRKSTPRHAEDLVKPQILTCWTSVCPKSSIWWEKKSPPFSDLSEAGCRILDRAANFQRAGSESTGG